MLSSPQVKHLIIVGFFKYLNLSKFNNFNINGYCISEKLIHGPSMNGLNS